MVTTAKSIRGCGDVALSFSGCGFLGTYHFGVLTCFTRNGSPFMRRIRRCAGASAGSLVAAYAVLAPGRTKEGLNKFYALAEELNSLRFGAVTPGFLLSDRLAQIIEEQLPMDISSAQGKLFVSLTHHKRRDNVLMSQFVSRAHLIKCLGASCYIPMYSTGFDAFASPPLIDNQPYVDGGYTNNLPEFADLPTVTISPFSGGATIAPHDATPLRAYLDWNMTLGNQQMKVNMQNIVRGAQALFPPSLDILEKYYEMGFRDALKFLIENELVERPEGTSV